MKGVIVRKRSKLKRVLARVVACCFIFFRSLGFGRGSIIKYRSGGGREEPERLPRGLHDTKFPSYPFEKRVCPCAQSRARARADCAVASGEGSTYFFRVIG